MARRRATEPEPPKRKAGRARSGDGWVKEIAPGKWRGAVTVKQLNGTSKRVWFSGTGREDVLAQITQRKTDAIKGVAIITGTTTVETYLTQWLDDAAANLRPQSLTAYRLHVRHINECLGGYQLARLQPEHVKRMHTALLKRGLSRTTVKLAHSILSSALDQAVDWEKLPRNVAKRVTPPRPEPAVTEPLSADEVRTLLGHIDAHQDRLTPLWLVLITTGVRLGEALGLHWADVDLDTAALTVRHQLRASDRQLSEPKSKAAYRTVPLSTWAVSALRAHRKEQREERLRTGLHPVWDAVFYTVKGEPYYQPVVTHRWRQMLDLASVRRVRVHDLRHGYITSLSRRGVQPREAQTLAGHSSLQLTLSRYTHVGADLHDRVRGHIDALFGPIVAVNSADAGQQGEKHA